MSERRALLLANRRSLAGASDLSAGIERLSESGVTVDSHAVDDPVEIPRIIARDAGRYDLIIIGGGDGTMNLASEALVESGRPLGILPIGTANDLARTLQIPSSVPDACAVIAEGRTRAIDLGRANDKYFFNVASIGLSAEVLRYHQGARKRWLRVLSYPLSVWDAFKTTRPFRARVRCDGRDATAGGVGQPGCKGPATSRGYWQDDAANRWLALDDAGEVHGVVELGERFFIRHATLDRLCGMELDDLDVPYLVQYALQVQEVEPPR